MDMDAPVLPEVKLEVGGAGSAPNNVREVMQGRPLLHMLSRLQRWSCLQQ
jgi:hypothetical protein